MRIFLLALISLVFLACSDKKVQAPKPGYSQAKASYETIMKINLACKPCKENDYEAVINGALYRSDIAIKCCSELRNVDLGPSLKKVYLHRDRKSVV